MTLRIKEPYRFLNFFLCPLFQLMFLGSVKDFSQNGLQALA